MTRNIIGLKYYSDNIKQIWEIVLKLAVARKILTSSIEITWMDMKDPLMLPATQLIRWVEKITERTMIIT